MASQDFAKKLVKSNYDLNNPLDTARFQQVVSEFMKLVRADSLGDPNGEELIDKFCKLVDDKQVWHLAQMVVPEFRSGREEQVHDYALGEGHACLIYVLNRLPSLPPPRTDINILVTEQDMVTQRHKQDVEYLVTRGRGKQGATSDELDDIDDSVRQVEAEKGRLQFKQSIKNEKKERRERTRKKKMRNEEGGSKEVEEVGQVQEEGGSEEVEEVGQVQEEGGSQGHKQEIKKLVIRGRELRPRVAKETSDGIEKEGEEDNGNDDDDDDDDDDDEDEDEYNDEDDDDDDDEEGDDSDREDDKEDDIEDNSEDDTEDNERDYKEDDTTEDEEEL